ncbi:MAG: hypothetical protein AVDCRST_MAG70-65 [uncultured Thermomicrobiales bacterium]|uniref:Uncharacterized protein n=1 Tax=uncultured Thermomicrobiales bacterium TaxID=1645740 RepID=A0A6J4U4H8_9BACT|nr:MAG: hypothetical protein AVDCRST_MAG70-65 [uncultured Thermomicrobiales bacterium]
MVPPMSPDRDNFVSSSGTGSVGRIEGAPVADALAGALPRAPAHHGGGPERWTRIPGR